MTDSNATHSTLASSSEVDHREVRIGRDWYSSEFHLEPYLSDRPDLVRIRDGRAYPAFRDRDIVIQSVYLDRGDPDFRRVSYIHDILHMFEPDAQRVLIRMFL